MTPVGPDGIDPRDLAGRVEALIADINGLEDPASRARAEELVRSVMELYGAGLERVVRILGDGDAEGAWAMERLVRDELVSSLLILHGLHPLGVEARVKAELDRLRQSFGPALELTLTTIDADLVSVRIGGRDLGCATDGLKQTIERALLAVAPELTRVEVQAAPPPPQLIQVRRSASAALR